MTYLKALEVFGGANLEGTQCCGSLRLYLQPPIPFPCQPLQRTKDPQVHQTPHFSQTCPTKERRLITESVAELTEFVSCAPLESLMEMRFGLRHLIATCKKTQSQRAHLVEEFQISRTTMHSTCTPTSPYGQEHRSISYSLFSTGIHL